MAINNLTIYNNTTFYSGLFGVIGDIGRVYNLKLNNATVSGTNLIGAIAGYSCGEISGCEVVVVLSLIAKEGDTACIGGIAGRAENICTNNTVKMSITVADSHNEITVGGIAGSYSSAKNATVVLNADVDINISSTGSIFAGGLFGKAAGITSIASSTVTGTILVASSQGVVAGGFAGHGPSISINNCQMMGDVTALATSFNSAVAGGLIGKGGDVTIIGSSIEGNVSSISQSSISYAGGLIGKGNVANINNCRTVCTVISRVITPANDNIEVYAGGLIGTASSHTTINKCQVEGTVTATSSVAAFAGGMIGKTWNETIIDNSSTAATVSAVSENASNAGGMVGRSALLVISNSYSTAQIVGGESVSEKWGGVVGYGGQVTLVNVHWLYFAGSGIEYAIGYGAELGLPTNGGTTKHNSITEFYKLADLLNAGQKELAWEHKAADTLPTLINR